MRAPIKTTVKPKIEENTLQETYKSVVAEYERLFGPLPDTSQSDQTKFIRDYDDEMTQFYDMDEYEFGFLNSDDQKRALIEGLFQLRNKIDEILEITI